tara:strand:- start:37 stop:297 length:261 start_codon:yes stop_codon:yes gene_type:complete
MEDVAIIIGDYGFPIVAMVGLGYFVYYMWTTLNNTVEPAVEEMHFALIKLIDQVRMLDNDLIRLQKKVDTILQMRENETKRQRSKP